MVLDSRENKLPEQDLPGESDAVHAYKAELDINMDDKAYQQALMRQESNMMDYVMNQLIGLASKLAPRLTAPLLNLRDDIRFNVQYQILENPAGFNLLAQLRSKFGDSPAENN
jgi:hypothetical protein